MKKAKDIIGFEREGTCSVCQKDLDHDAGIYTVCPSPECEAVTHVTCLSKHFLEDDTDSLIPIKGRCPSCKSELIWIDIVKELSLRMRGQKEVERLLKPKRVRKGKDTASQSVIDSDIEDEDDYDLEADIEDELKRLQEFNPTGARMDIADRRDTLAADSDDSDASLIVSTVSQSKPSAKAKTKLQGEKTRAGPQKGGILQTVIEDSDRDDAVVLD